MLINYRNMKQRSPEWFSARLGKFTASDAIKLLGNGKRTMTEEELEQYKKENPKGKRTTIDCIGETLETHAFEKACELVFGLDEEDDFDSFDMRRGRELEPLAFAKFKELKSYDFMEVQETTFFAFGKDAGASPDGLADADCLEIKCPRPKKFFKIVAKGIRAVDPEYIAQVQFQMMCTNSQRCHFFNYIIHKGREMWHEIIIDRDEKMISNFKERLPIAVKLRDEFVEYLTNNRQF